MKKFTKISKSFPGKVEKLCILSASFVTFMKLQDKRSPSNNTCKTFCTIQPKNAVYIFYSSKSINYQIHEVRNPCRQYFPTLKICPNSAREEKRERLFLHIVTKRTSSWQKIRSWRSLMPSKKVPTQKNLSRRHRGCTLVWILLNAYLPNRTFD